MHNLDMHPAEIYNTMNEDLKTLVSDFPNFSNHRPVTMPKHVFWIGDNVERSTPLPPVAIWEIWEKFMSTMNGWTFSPRGAVIIRKFLSKNPLSQKP